MSSYSTGSPNEYGRRAKINIFGPENMVTLSRAQLRILSNKHMVRVQQFLRVQFWPLVHFDPGASTFSPQIILNEYR